MIKRSNSKNKTDVILIGAGIMSSTLGTMLNEWVPEWNIKIFEKIGSAREESSNEWNNAGTGHSAFCELNYTPEHEDGGIDVSKAVKIAESFEISRQFWAYLVQQNKITAPENFINSIPHMSFVWGGDNVNYLEKRYSALKENHLFDKMEFSTDYS